jgi:hypothetical protein
MGQKAEENAFKRRAIEFCLKNGFVRQIKPIQQTFYAL